MIEAALRCRMVAAGVAALLVSCISCRGPERDMPIVLDNAFEMTLAASDPDVVTPIGMAVDDRDRLFVLESHTHVRPSDYQGPEADLIKILKDADGDGRLEIVGVFAEGFEDGMNLAFSPDGVLHLVTSRAVWALHDTDGDDVCDERVRVLHMERPESVYDHAGLMGITFSDDGWMYISRGNVGGQEWRLIGSDGSRLEGYGDGGNIVRLRPDGSRLHEVATGFWNPFYVFVDSQGRLMATDNDPDSRGPNRLLHVIEGGDYGYESLYGGSGIHPYLAWNGELPGTLPYAAGLGEAPSGCVETAAPPEDDEQIFLCAIWEESSIVRVRLSQHGASVQGEVEPLIRGDADFRPVVMAATNDGSIYVTDWVLRRYPSHGRGRIWRLISLDGTSRGVRTTERRGSTPESRDRSAPSDQGKSTVQSRSPKPDQPTDSPAIAERARSAAGGAADLLDEISAAGDRGDVARLRQALTSDDPFVRSASVTALARPALVDDAAAAAKHSNADVRLGALLALMRSEYEPKDELAGRLLFDSDPRIRRMALIWIGKAGMTSLRLDVEMAADRGLISPDLFPTYLATIRHLDPSFISAYRNREAASSHDLQRMLPAGFIASIAADTTRPAELRSAALTHLENPTEHFDLLASLANEEGLTLRRSAVRMIARTAHPDRGRLLLEVAENRSHDAELRADAVLGLSEGSVEVSQERVATLLHDPDEIVRFEAARFLRGVQLTDRVREEIDAAYTSADHPRLREALAFILDKSINERPSSLAEWTDAIATGGDPAIGRRVFFWPVAQCARCHAVDGLGGDVGPDLSNVGASKTRAQIIRSVVDPSADVAPDWQGWYVRDSDGGTHYGRQIDVGSDAVELYTLKGRFVEFEGAREWGVVETSLMPDGLESALTVHDFRDLVSFLKQTK